jgi:hypothetical protein
MQEVLGLVPKADLVELQAQVGQLHIPAVPVAAEVVRLLKHHRVEQEFVRHHHHQILVFLTVALALLAISEAPHQPTCQGHILQLKLVKPESVAEAKVEVLEQDHQYILHLHLAVE